MTNLENTNWIDVEHLNPVESVNSVDLSNIVKMLDDNDVNESADFWEKIKWYCDIEELIAFLEQGSPEKKQAIKNKLFNYIDHDNWFVEEERKRSIIYVKNDEIVIKYQYEGWLPWEKVLTISWKWRDWIVNSWATK